MTTETQSDLGQEIIELVAYQLGAEPGRVTPQARFIQDLGADSLDVVELIMAFEDRFGIAFDDVEAEKIQTVGEAVQHVEEAVARAHSAAKPQQPSDDSAFPLRRASYE